ncbi:PaaI family thioesterase [Paraburkholderia youngii]|uniref:PaaI family thioesterase n=1 Tax=Paraburkholderia youngii TaxID=2782701 RepID=UPI003D1FE346
MGDMTIRLASVTPRTVRGVKSDPISMFVHIIDFRADNDTLSLIEEERKSAAVLHPASKRRIALEQTDALAVFCGQADDEGPIPEGFALMPAFGPFHQMFGPTYFRKTERGHVIGMYVREAHRNLGQMMHGGAVCMLADTAITWASKHSREPAVKVLTTSLTVNFMGNAEPGDWVEARVDVLRSGRRVIFSDCQIWANAKCIAQASGQFQVMGAFDN